MVLTLDSFIRTTSGNKHLVICNCDFDSAYTASGEALTAANLGFKKIEFLLAAPKSGYVFNYDYTNSVLRCYLGDNDADADGVMAESGENDNLASLTDVKIFAIGYGRG